MESTLENYQRVYEMLADDLSKSIYINRINALITDDCKYIKAMTPRRIASIASRVPVYDKDVIPADGKIILYGTGQIARDSFTEWSTDKRIISLCSQNEEKQETGYLGYPVMSPEELLAQDEYFVVVSVANCRDKEEILNILSSAKYPAGKIFFLIEGTNDTYQYFPDDIKEMLDFTDNEVFLDVGCYRLETSIEFKRRCPQVKKIYAFEPDPVNYKACLEKKAQIGLAEAEILPLGTWSHKDTLFFTKGGTPNATVVEAETSLSLDVISIDEVIPSSEKVTFIKMDIEGAELESLKGAKKIIQRDKPKLAICIYHKSEDMLEIPLYIAELVPEYKIYIRHHSNTMHETVLYAIPQE